jgi:hypothetical protein
MADDVNPFAHIRPGATPATDENPFARIVPPTGQQSAIEEDAIGAAARPYVVDALKQAGAGLVTGTEAIPAAPAQAAGLLGGLVQKVLPESWQNAPLARAVGVDSGGPSAADQQSQLRDVIKANRGEGIANYLPEAKTEFGKSVRGIMEFVPSTVASTGLSVPRAIGIGLTAGAGSEAAGRATEGTAAEPYARAAGALITGVGATRQAERAAARAATPTIEQLHEQAGRGYDAVRRSGLEIKPEAAANFSQATKAALTETGLDNNLASKTWGILDKLDNAPPGATMTAQNFQSLRKTLGNAAGSIDPQERLAATIAKNRLDDFLGNLTPAETLAGNPQQASALLREANGNYAAAERAAGLDRRITAAQLRAASANSGMNVENTVRQRMAAILVNPALQRGFSPGEIAQMRRLVEGPTAANAMRTVSGALGGGGGRDLAIAALGGGAAGGALSYGTGDPSYLGLSGVTPLAGLGLRYLGGRRALSHASDIGTMTRMRSPLAGQVVVPTGSPLSPFGVLPPTLGALGANYDTEGIP